jgi:tol-pal system protein YbgF
MSPQTNMPPARIAAAFFAALTMAFAAGCADTGPSQAPSNDFEIRAMIASDRQAMHAMDERLGRIENQLQELTHNGGGQTAASDAGNAPAPPAPAPPGPPSDAGPVTAPATVVNPPMGAPPAPAGPLGAPPPDTGGPSGAAVAPGGNVPPGAAAGAAASPENPAPGTDSDTTTIASAPGPAPGAASPSNEENASTGSTSPSSDEGATEGEAPAAAPAATNDSGNPAASAPEGAPGGEANASGGDEGTAPAGGEAAAPGNGAANAPGGGEAAAPGSGAANPSGVGEDNAPHAGEEVASVARSTPPENAPAAEAAPRWPQDLAHELQSPSSSKGGAGKLYVSGLDAMKSRDYAAAVQRFDTIQKKFPHSDLTEPAAYFSANALNEMGKYDQAILQYNDLVMRYPKGKYSSEALLREAQAFVQINDKIDARLTLQKLTSEHPGTPQAATANDMMKSMDSN